MPASRSLKTPYVHCLLSANTTITSAAGRTVPYDVEVKDTHDMHRAGNLEKFYAPISGLYLAIAKAVIQSGTAVGYRSNGIGINGTSIFRAFTSWHEASNTYHWYSITTAMIEMSAGDYLVHYMDAASLASFTAVGGTGHDTTSFQMRWMGPL